MGKDKTTPKGGDLAALSPEELLAFATEAQAKVAELESALKLAEEKVANLETALVEGTETIKASEKTIAELAAKVGQFEQDLEGAMGINAELQKALEDKPVAGALPEIKHEGKTYQVMLPKFRYNREIHTAESLKSNKELVGKLLDIKSGVLKLKEG